MTRNFLFLNLFILSSCANINYSYFNDLRNIISRNEIIVDQSFIENQKFSFIKVSNNKNDAIFVLYKISSSGIYEWIGSNFEKIKTKDGLIVETFGLESDIKFLLTNFSVANKDADIIHSYINLYNPDLLYHAVQLSKQSSTMSIENGLKRETLIFERRVPSIGWSAKDTYIYQDGVIHKSIQDINPLMEPLEITFYFKY